MRKNNFVMTIATLIVGCVMLIGCTGNDDVPAGFDRQMTDCTIIFYGAGGTNLDADIYENLRQLYRGIADHNNVEAVVFFKNSSNIEDSIKNILDDQGFDFHKATTYRFCVDRSLDDNVQMQFTDENIFGGDSGNINITIVDTMAHYISYAAAMRPARHYVFVLADHGHGYAPQDERPEILQALSRGLMADDGNNMQCCTERGIRTAIERSGVDIDAVYIDACEMNTVETIYELSGVTKYIVSGTYVTPSVGGDYTSLVERLATCPDYGLAMAGYCDDVADWWKRCEETSITPEDYIASDITVVDTQKLLMAAPALKRFIDQLTLDYTDSQLASQIDAVTARAKANDNYGALYDLCAYFDSLMVGVSSVALADAAREARDLMMQCKLNSRGTVTTEQNGLPSFNFLLGANGSWIDIKYNDDGGLKAIEQFYWDGTKTTTNYNTDGTVLDTKDSTWGNTGDETYGKLIFETLTGWSRWLKQNRLLPSPNV
jgi:hypothetical protein